MAFKTFLNMTPAVSFPPNQSGGVQNEFVLSLDDNPLAEFAELPRDAREGGLWFSNVLAGVVRGALEMVSVVATAVVVMVVQPILFTPWCRRSDMACG